MTRVLNVPLRVSVPAGTNACRSSSLLRDVLQIPEILMIFPPNTSNLLIYRIFEDTTPNVPASGLPGGIELTGEQIDAGEYVGDGTTYSVPSQYVPKDNPVCIKLYAQNDSLIDLIASVIVSLVV